MTIDDLELTIRSSRQLKNAGVTTVEQLINLDWNTLNSIPNIGKVSVNELCWACVSVMSGRFLEGAMRIDKYLTKGYASQEDTKKARKYDALMKAIEGVR